MVFMSIPFLLLVISRKDRDCRDFNMISRGTICTKRWLRKMGGEHLKCSGDFCQGRLLTTKRIDKLHADIIYVERWLHDRMRRNCLYYWWCEGPHLGLPSSSIRSSAASSDP